MLTADRIIIDAKQAANLKGFELQAQDAFKAILSDLCHTTETALARGMFTFNFNPGLTTLFGSGPYNLPLDYLRTSGTSGAEGVTRAAWFLYPAPAYPAGQPMPLVPIDLGEFDMYPQLPAQGIPSTIATDMGGPLTQRIRWTGALALTQGSTTATPFVMPGLAADLGVAGEGIVPGTTIVSVGVSTIVLSNAATATLPTASVFCGIAPVCYIYPPPVGPYPCTIRYQRMMPPLIDMSQYPWFPMDGYLIEKLTAKLMAFSGDSREAARDAKADADLRRYLGLSDDKTNRAQTVQLDARRYGTGANYARLKNTKVAGW